MSVTLRTLRVERPDWAWTAERAGMGWRYVGARGGRQVVVFACARLIGEDEFATEWRVDDGAISRSYVSWWLECEARSA